MEIRILPGNIANMIAAGEVVQRPASVVKELMENSLDAGADSVSVNIKDAGRTLIQVIDNGCGMSPDDAVLCFERHATSKLATAEDLDNILTFGFRGEALASIASIAEVTLKTRREEDELAVQVCFANSKQESIEQLYAPKGSNFAVRNIFYNVPARRKYLKSDNVEFKHIVEEFTRVALTRPDVAFTLSHNDRETYVLRKANSLKYRIQDLLGSTSVENIIDLSVETSVVSIDGYVCKPEAARKTQGNQFFFVNGRYFRSPYLHKAVMKAYEELIPQGYNPTYFINLHVPADTLDVNISPTKTEIKFSQDSLIFQTLYACVKEAIGKFSFSDSIDFERGGIPEMPVVSSKFEDLHPVTEPLIGTDPSYNPFDNDGFASEEDSFSKPLGGTGHESPGFGRDFSSALSRTQDYGKLFEDNIPLSRPAIIVRSKYIVTELNGTLTVVNVKRAWERILYERFMEAATKNAHVTQTMLFPETVVVGVQNRLVLDDNATLLASLGFDIRPFGQDTVVLEGVPEGFNVQNGRAEQLVGDILAILNEAGMDLEESIQSSLASKFAFMGAVGGKPMTNPAEAQKLVDCLLSCKEPERTASGHKTIAVLSIENIDKLF